MRREKVKDIQYEKTERVREERNQRKTANALPHRYAEQGHRTLSYPA